jgi:DNA processing protein
MACPDCLARGLLLRRLAANIDRSVDRAAGSRARDLLALGDEDLAAAVGGREAARELRCASSDAADADLRADLDRLGCWAVCAHDPDWPAAFGRLGAAAPRALFGRGERGLLEAACGRPAVTVIGARRAGSYGISVATALAAELAAAGLAVISGMALGADTAAHRGALEGGGITVAVLASGPERPYPRSRGRLYGEICASGLVLSELPPDTPTFRWGFPARNRLMAALAEITIVVEAAERSGSLITAEMAADCGRLVGAVPGPVTSWRSAGTNMLLADGACVIRGAQDVIDQLLGPGARVAPTAGPPLGPTELAVLDAVERGAGGAEAVAGAAGIGIGAASASIARLELAGYVGLDFAGRITRTALPRPTDSAANTIGT